ncbi:MAG: peptidase MA family metallohydrolase [Nanoarchaeota archaeon]
MEKKADLGFCSLIFSSEDSNINYEKEFIIQAYNFNMNFARIDIPKFEIKIVNSRSEFENIWGSKTPDYVSAFTKDDNIVIFSYGIFEKETKWPKEKFEEALIHEINHLFYQELRDDEYDPLWLSEGLATFMQHKKKKHKYKKQLRITKKILNQSFEEMSEESYQVFTLFVEFLILVYGEKNILQFIKELKEGKNIDLVFKEIYKKSFEELIKDGNRYYKIT